MKPEPCRDIQHYVTKAVHILQRIGTAASSAAGENSGHYDLHAEDIGYVVATLSEMEFPKLRSQVSQSALTDVHNPQAAKHASLVHSLEMASLERVKYYENSPNMVSMFRRKIQDMIPDCRAQALQKLQATMNSVKAVSKELTGLKTYRRSLREDNNRLKVLVEQVAKETEQIMNTVLEYYNRRSQNKDAIAVALESVNATEERVSLVEHIIGVEQEDWEEEDILMRLKEYDLALTLRLEKDEIMLEEEAAAAYDQEEAALRDKIAKLAKEIEHLKRDYLTNMIVIRAQNKINEAVIGKTLQERANRIADVERWALRIESPLLYPESEEDLDDLDDDEEPVQPDKGYESEEVERATGPPDIATAEDLELLFRPVYQEDGSESSGFNKDEWEGILGSFDTVEQLQAKIRTLVAKEKHLNDETQRLKRQLAARTRKMGKLKRDLIELNDQTIRLQQDCDGLFNTLRDLEELDETVRERSTKELRQMRATTAEELDLMKSLKQEIRLLEYELDDFSLVSSMELADLRDSVLDQQDAEEEIKSSAAIEFQRHALMSVQIECGRVEWQCQEALRTELAAEYAYFLEQLRLFGLEFDLLTSTLDHEDYVFDSLYSFYTARTGEMAILCGDLSKALDDGQQLIEVWKGQIAQTRLLNSEVQKHLDTSVSSAHTFTVQLEGDLTELNRSFVSYSIMSKICQNYIPYVLDQTRTPVAASMRLLHAIRKMVEDRPKIALEVDLKKNIAKSVTDRLLESGSTAGEEYDQGAVFLRSTLQSLQELRTMSSSVTDFLSLLKTQSRKISDIGDRFTSPLLRKQINLDININMGPSGDCSFLQDLEYVDVFTAK